MRARILSAVKRNQAARRTRARSAAATATDNLNTLSITSVSSGYPTHPMIAEYHNYTHPIFCNPPGGGTFYSGDLVAPCAKISFKDYMMDTSTPASNESTSYMYDACGNLVGSSTMYNWYSSGNPNGDLNSPATVGGATAQIPAEACGGTWTIYYRFRQTFRNGGSLTADAGGSFTVKPDQHLDTSDTHGGFNPAELKCTQACVGDPVNTATGDFWESTKDLAIAGRGPGLLMDRTYSSLAAAAGEGTSLGRGWSFGYAMSLKGDAGDTVTIKHGNGSQVHFSRDASGTYTAPGRVLASLSKNSDATWTYIIRGRTTYTFSAVGRLTSIADRNANKVTLAYNAAGQLSSAADGAGRTFTFAYDPTSGLLASVTDSGGRKVSYSHDAAGDLSSVTDVRGGTSRYTYDANHLLLTREDANGKVLTNTYDADARTVTQRDPLGHTTRFAYNGKPATATDVTDPRGNTTRYEYRGGVITSETRGLGTAMQAKWSFTHDRRTTLGLTSVTDPLGRTTTHTYDSAGNRTSTTTPLGHVTRWTFDGQNNLTSTRDALGTSTTMTYDSRGNRLTNSTPLTGSTLSRTVKWVYATNGDVLSLTDPNAKLTTMTYTSAGDQASVTDPLGNKTSYTYDHLGRRLTTVSPKGNVRGATPSQFTTTSTYDAAGNVLSSADALGRKRTRTYDPVGNVSTITDAKNRTTRYGYDALNRRTSTTRPDGALSRTGFDEAGNMTSQTDPGGRPTTYEYDALNRRESTTDALGRKTTFSYDAKGNVVATVDPAGRTTSSTYDEDGRLTRTDYSDAETPSVVLAYDANDRRTAMTDGTGTSTNTFDSLGRLTKVVDGRGSATTYTYDIADRQTGITYPQGKTVTKTLDDIGRTIGITDWLGGKTAFAYDAESRLTTTTFPTVSKNVDTVAYDNVGRVSSITMAKGTAVLGKVAYTRDVNGQVASETPTGLPGTSTTYEYDGLDRLSAAAGRSYVYDDGDRPTTIAGVPGHEYDAANQLTQAPSATYAYDSVGQRTGRIPASGTPTSYGYDQAGQLTSHTGSSTTRYAYDGEGFRVSRTAGSTTTAYTWDHSALVPQLIREGATSYIYGPTGKPLAEITDGGTISYYHQDQLGSTRMLTNASGTVVGTFTYDAYGNQTGATGSATTPLGYAGEYRDAESGLIYLRARHYDPQTAQFLTPDPLISQTRQRYTYAGDNPVNNVDPWGDDFLGIGNALSEAGQGVVDHAGTIGTIAGGLAFVPVLTPIAAPIALGATFIQTWKDVDDGNWGSAAFGAASLGTGGAALGFFNRARNLRNADNSPNPWMNHRNRAYARNRAQAYARGNWAASTISFAAGQNIAPAANVFQNSYAPVTVYC